MPRCAREKSITGIYHMILRGVNRQNIFEDEEDAVRFLGTLKKFKKESEYEIYAYCLMGNHIHILIKEGKEDLGIAMRRIGASYVYWYNWKYERVGHLFQDRFKSEAVEDDKYLLTVLRYIHQNPLKAGLVKDIREYKWSSYIEYLYRDSIVNSDFILSLFDKDINKAVVMFKEFHDEVNSSKILDIEDKKIIKDSEAIEIIKKNCNVVHCADIQNFNREQRDTYLKTLKNRGLSTRQIARITGISRGIVLKA